MNQSLTLGVYVKVRLFAGASAVVMVHGAANTNTIALMPSAQYIELSPEGFSWVQQWQLSRALGNVSVVSLPAAAR